MSAASSLPPPLRPTTLLSLLLALLAACSSQPVPSPSPTAAVPPNQGTLPAGSASPTPEPPTETPTPEPPLAARVNGEGITLEDFQREVGQVELGAASAGADPTELGNYRATALETLIQQKVIEQAAMASGFSVSEAEVQAQIDSAKQARGGEEGFADWLEANLYTEEQFRVALKAQMLSALIVDHIAGQVPTTAEHVHARHVLVATESEAQAILAQLRNGADFAALALAHSLDLSSRVAGGDLGWFPRGLLTQPEVEEAAFNLQPGELSGVIHSELGYHIVQTLERDPARELSPAVRQLVQEQAVERWLQEQLDQAILEQIITP